jgi:hypothetical protein
MTDYDTARIRESVIAALVQRRPGLGRTALMKLIYFLQTLRGVPLGYSFRIYTYGPYDGQVLDDLQAVESTGAVRSQYYEYEYGTGYSIAPLDGAAELAHLADEQLGHDLDWVVREFGDKGVVDLEMASTIIFVDRRNSDADTHKNAQDIALAVHEMKPHLSVERIENELDTLKKRGLLRAVA